MMDVALLRTNGARAADVVLSRTSRVDGSALERLAHLIATERLVHEQEDLSPSHPLGSSVGPKPIGRKIPWSRS